MVVDISCPGNARTVSDRLQEVANLFTEARPNWPSVDEWRTLLPAWILEPESSDAESWPLADWLYWMEPQNSEWEIQEVKMTDPDHLVVRLGVDGWPAPLGAFEWLATAAGAAHLTY